MSPLNQALEMILPLVGTLGAFILVGFIVWLLNRTRRDRVLRMIELQGRMLEKFTSSDEFAAFIRTPEGQRYLRDLAGEPQRNPKQKILTAIKTGVVLVVLAVGLIAVPFIAGIEHPMEEPPLIFGFLALFLGLGFLASAAVSYSMSKAWGLFPEDQKPTATTNQS